MQDLTATNTSSAPLCQVTRRGDRDRYSKIADAFHTPILVKVLRIVGLSLLSLLCLQKIRNR